eukprot:scaffold76795_cov14-Tisochrysis_lutea.AAC.1
MLGAKDAPGLPESCVGSEHLTVHAFLRKISACPALAPATMAARFAAEDQKHKHICMSRMCCTEPLIQEGDFDQGAAAISALWQRGISCYEWKGVLGQLQLILRAILIG